MRTYTHTFCSTHFVLLPLSSSFVYPLCNCTFLSHISSSSFCGQLREIENGATQHFAVRSVDTINQKLISFLQRQKNVLRRYRCRLGKKSAKFVVIYSTEHEPSFYLLVAVSDFFRGISVSPHSLCPTQQEQCKPNDDDIAPQQPHRVQKGAAPQQDDRKPVALYSVSGGHPRP